MLLWKYHRCRGYRRNSDKTLRELQRSEFFNDKVAYLRELQRAGNLTYSDILFLGMCDYLPAQTLIEATAEPPLWSLAGIRGHIESIFLPIREVLVTQVAQQDLQIEDYEGYEDFIRFLCIFNSTIGIKYSYYFFDAVCKYLFDVIILNNGPSDWINYYQPIVDNLHLRPLPSNIRRLIANRSGRQNLTQVGPFTLAGYSHEVASKLYMSLVLLSTFVMDLPVYHGFFLDKMMERFGNIYLQSISYVDVKSVDWPEMEKYIKQYFIGHILDSIN